MKKEDIPENRSATGSWLRRYPKVLLLTGLALLLTLCLFEIGRRAEKAHLRAAFTRISIARLLALERSVRHNMSDLKTLAGFFETASDVDKTEFQTFSQLLTSGNSPHFQTLAWIPRLSRDERQAMMQSSASFRITEWSTDGALVSAGDRKAYYPVYYLEPRAGNDIALGYDLNSDPVLGGILRRSRDAGRPMAANSTALPRQPPREMSILLLQPVPLTGKVRYSADTPHRPVEGFVLGVLNVRNFFKYSIAQFQPAGIDIRIYDESLPEGQQLLYCYRPKGDRENTATEMLESPDISHVRTIQVADRRWRIVCTPTPLFLKTAASWIPESLLGAGILFSLLLAVHLRRRTDQSRCNRRETEALAEEIDNLRRELDQARHARDRLSEAERSLRSLIECIPQGVGICDPAGVVTFSNPACNHLFGTTEDEMRGVPVWILADTAEGREELRRCLRHLIHEQPEPEPRYLQSRKPDGRLHILRLDLNCRRDERQRPIGFFFALSEIVEGKESPREAASQAREFGQESRNRKTGNSAANPASTPPGVSAPRATRAPPGSSVPLPAPRGAGTSTARPAARILLVEDNRVNLQVAEAMLKATGNRVDTAQNGWEALDRLTAEEYDLVFMDCQMPGLDGYEATRLLREREASGERARRIPIVAITAHALEDDRERCLAAGMDDYLSKPFTKRQVTEILYLWLPEKEAAESPEGDGAREIPPHPPAPAASSDVADEEVLDQKILARIRDLRRRGSEPLLPKIIALYLADAPGLVKRIGEAAGKGDMAEASGAAHALKSSSANVGAVRLSQLCRELELMTRRGETGGIRERATGIENEFVRVSEALKSEGERCT